jgi:hypothetical protein
MNFKKSWINIIFSAFILLIIGITPSISFAQQELNQWSPYQRVPGIADDALPPYLVADQNRTVHAFTSQWVGVDNPQFAVMYTKWSLNEGWASPVDILLSPIKEARVMGALLDKTGIMHLIFFGGDQMGGDIYYSRAPAVFADRATAWSTPLIVGKEAIDPNTAALVGDIDGNLIIVYSGNLEGNGVYFVRSSDSGDTWSDPSTVFTTNSDTLVPYSIQLYLSESGNLHAVWNEVDQSGHNQAGYYAKLNLKSNQWSSPIEFDKSIGSDVGMGIAFPEVIQYKNDIFIMYNNGIPPSGVPPSQWYIRSVDGGISWSVPVRISQRHVGKNGISSFIIDNENILHVIFINRIPITINGVYDAIGGVFHTIWSGMNWSEPDAIVAMSASQAQSSSLMGPQTPQFNPYDARAVISQGNVILATWRTDPGLPGNGVWYSFLHLDTPELPLLSLQQPSQATIHTSIISSTTTPSSETSIDQKSSTIVAGSVSNNSASYYASVTKNPGFPLSISIIIVATLLFGVFITHTIHRR